ncbi:hypothetical protein M9H77_05617 [Catharanthus roseus]|uniref:Uncharacterized protein n=1 Tax=Catharanthus roseus TaxID=4058 RepID=A0ACC0CHV6_CATRO|nr:hypothetical protein M9H77_05617 [Catharanthus roseus]
MKKRERLGLRLPQEMKRSLYNIINKFRLNLRSVLIGTCRRFRRRSAGGGEHEFVSFFYQVYCGVLCYSASLLSQMVGVWALLETDIMHEWLTSESIGRSSSQEPVFGKYFAVQSRCCFKVKLSDQLTQHPNVQKPQPPLPFLPPSLQCQNSKEH